MEDGLEQRRGVLTELLNESELRNSKISSAKENTRKFELETVELEFQKKKQTRELENNQDLASNLKRENLRKKEQVEGAKGDTSSLEAKRRKLMSDLSRAEEIHAEVNSDHKLVKEAQNRIYILEERAKLANKAKLAASSAKATLDEINRKHSQISMGLW